MTKIAATRLWHSKLELLRKDWLFFFEKEKNMDMVFCSTARNHGIIDFAVMRAGVLVGDVSGETIEEVSKRYPGAYLTTYDAAIELQKASLITAPVEITEEVFIDALECLPPMNWKRGGSAESFKMCEFISGTITCIYARIGKRYFSMQDSAFLTHDEIVAKVQAMEVKHG